MAPRDSGVADDRQSFSARALLTELVGGIESMAEEQPRPVQRAVAWARVSTGMQERKGLSIPEQLREIRRYANRHEIDIVGEFSEAASAFRHEEMRVEFRRMLATAMADPGITLVLVHDSSRFSRHSLRAEALTAELRDVGVRVVSVTEPQIEPDTSIGVFMEALTFAKNEAYSREIGLHVTKGCRANIATRDTETGWCYKNGGDPLWGYRAVNLIRGERRPSRPIVKRIWLLDDTVIAEAPTHEWVRHCLVELAGGGAPLGEICEFCDRVGIPPRRRAHQWDQTTWISLLTLGSLLQYCGHGVWGVHDNQHRTRPTEDWAITPNAHPAIITAEEARAIAAVRRDLSLRKLHGSFTAASSLRYLISGGLFRCRRCGRSMVGYLGDRYTCRTRMLGDARAGCGRRTNVNGKAVESGVIAGLEAVLQHLRERGVVRELNRQLVAAWRQQQSGGDVCERPRVTAEAGAATESVAADSQPPHTPEQNRLPTVGSGGSGALRFVDRPPRIDGRALASSVSTARRVLREADRAALKRLLRRWVERVEFNPDSLVVEAVYRIPEDVTCPTAAGTWCKAHSPALAAALVWRFPAARPCRRARPCPST